MVSRFPASSSTRCLHPGAVGENEIEGNFIGTNATGMAPEPNGNDGITVVDSAANTIGGETVSTGNLISGNGQSGIAIVDAASNANVVEGNYIGTDVTGTNAVSNSRDGVAFGELLNPVVGVGYASNNTVGGTAAGARNIISGNGWTEFTSIRVPETLCRAITSARTLPAQRPCPMIKMVCVSRTGRRTRSAARPRCGQRHLGECRERRRDRLDCRYRGRLFHPRGGPVVDFQCDPGE